MGPVSGGGYWGYRYRITDSCRHHPGGLCPINATCQRHKSCRDGIYCTGVGCKLSTGKTATRRAAYREERFAR